MSKSLARNWQIIHDVLPGAVSIAWGECHKIYILMDEEQHREMISYGYDPLLRIDQIGVDSALATLRRWWDESCGLRFVNSVKTVEGNPNDGFVTLIGQFEDD